MQKVHIMLLYPFIVRSRSKNLILNYISTFELKSEFYILYVQNPSYFLNTQYFVKVVAIITIFFHFSRSWTIQPFLYSQTIEILRRHPVISFKSTLRYFSNWFPIHDCSTYAVFTTQYHVSQFLNPLSSYEADN